MSHHPTITLRNLLPAVFADERQCHADSDIWLRDTVEFMQSTHYLIKAASGKGKSSLCAYLYGDRTDYTGNITVNGIDVSNLSTDRLVDLRRKHIAYLPQDLGLFPTLTALENIRLKNNLTSHKTDDEIRGMLDTVGMAGLVDRPVAKLSLGQQQRVAIVRAMCQPFDILLLDEPVSHLDSNANLAVSRLIEKEASANNATLIVTSVGNDLALSRPVIMQL
ncbi:MAG: ATP-binding cassette domain-containing protein [Muribaculaceae bacterium]|nr:ATP-binding cassette domain-containing protein [Muribaculaceae bacterium]